jgi:superoxide dismutase, Fe-Mn family
MAAPFTLPALPWADNALDPIISANTMSFHHGKHHKAYVDNLNKLVEGTPMADQSLEAIIKASAGDASKAGLFNNSAQIWNHTFFWHSMAPNAGGMPTGKVAEMIDRDLGGYDKFKEEFAKAAMGRFGSGWAWLSLADGKLAISSTPNAETPLTTGATPLLTIDVWEHAYYLDHQNRRADFVNAIIDKLMNWNFANENLAKS